MRLSLMPLVGLGVALVGGMAGLPAGAQTMDTAGPHNAYCGAWVSGTWTPNGNCVTETTTAANTTTTAVAAAPIRPGVMTKTRATAAAGMAPERVTGTITAVNGHLVTIQRAAHTLVIDDRPALDKQTTGRVAVGRVVTAHGYWQGGTFFADRLATATVSS